MEKRHVRKARSTHSVIAEEVEDVSDFMTLPDESPQMTIGDNWFFKEVPYPELKRDNMVTKD